jgi:hypothetical protein
MMNFNRRGAAALAVVLLGAPVTGAQTVPARDVPRFIGTWRLVSATTTGIMIYDSLGNMAAQVMPNRVRRKYAAAEPTPEEAKDAITGYLAYFGTYSVDEQARTVTHHRKGNINPGGWRRCCPGLRVRVERPARPHPCREYEQDRVGAGPITAVPRRENWTRHGREIMQQRWGRAAPVWADTSGAAH